MHIYKNDLYADRGFTYHFGGYDGYDAGYEGPMSAPESAPEEFNPPCRRPCPPPYPPCPPPHPPCPPCPPPHPPCPPPYPPCPPPYPPYPPCPPFHPCPPCPKPEPDHVKFPNGAFIVSTTSGPGAGDYPFTDPPLVAHNVSVSDTKITIHEAGVYKINYALFVNSIPVGTSPVIQLNLNGLPVNGTVKPVVIGRNGGVVVLSLSAGDFFQIHVSSIVDPPDNAVSAYFSILGIA